jgi:hypothetical protein
MELYLRFHRSVDLLYIDHALHQLGGNQVIIVISLRGVWELLVTRVAGFVIHNMYHNRFPLMQDGADDLLKISQCVRRVAIR